MIGTTFVFGFALCALAIWRVSHLLAKENGPWDLIARMREAMGSNVMGRLMDCFYCLSFLVSLAPALWLSSTPAGFLLHWLSLSAVACLVERATQKGQGALRVAPVSSSYLDKVIRGL
ncbi:MAG: hypothetical protein ABR907_10365 [Terracidiphilus sp.]|jgi:hypothetical protein